MLNIIRAGIYTSVQDSGRHGFRQSGLSHCGALDKPAFQTANLLVGNDANAPALEITLGQLVVEFENETWFALTGAGCEAQLDDQPVWTGWRLPVKRVSVLRCIDRFTGCVAIWRWRAVLLCRR